MIIKSRVNQKTISKKIGAEMCIEIGVDPKFLDNKEFEEISSSNLSTLTNSKNPPLATISFLNNNTKPYSKNSKKEASFWTGKQGYFSSKNTYECFDENQYERPMEFTQMAEMAVPTNYIASSSPKNENEENLLVTLPILGAVFLITTLSYLMGLSKLKNTAWYKKNYSSNESREEWYKQHIDITYEKIEKLSENQRKILENQKKIAENQKKSSQNQDELLKNQNQILKLLKKN